MSFDIKDVFKLAGLTDRSIEALMGGIDDTGYAVQATTLAYTPSLRKFVSIQDLDKYDALLEFLHKDRDRSYSASTGPLYYWMMHGTELSTTQLHDLSFVYYNALYLNDIMQLGVDPMEFLLIAWVYAGSARLTVPELTAVINTPETWLTTLPVGNLYTLGAWIRMCKAIYGFTVNKVVREEQFNAVLLEVYGKEDLECSVG